MSGVNGLDIEVAVGPEKLTTINSRPPHVGPRQILKLDPLDALATETSKGPSSGLKSESPFGWKPGTRWEGGAKGGGLRTYRAGEYILNLLWEERENP